jgi:hypothetical protein
MHTRAFFWPFEFGSNCKILWSSLFIVHMLTALTCLPALGQDEGSACLKLVADSQDAGFRTDPLSQPMDLAGPKLRIGFFRQFDLPEFNRFRAHYLELLDRRYPRKLQENAQSGEDAKSQPGERAESQPGENEFDISKSSPPEQKLAFLEALGGHFISNSVHNPLLAEKILNTRWIDFLKKRRFFIKLKKLQIGALTSREIEELFVDLYTLQNPGTDSLPKRIRALVGMIIPFRNGIYETWYSDIVLRRFYVEVLKSGLISALEATNFRVKTPLFGDSHESKMYKKIAKLSLSLAINWYVLIPTAQLFGYIHLPEINLSEWSNLTKLIQDEVKRNPKILDQIISGEFRHELVEQWVNKYGGSYYGAKAKFDLFYRTLRSLYLRLILPSAIYLFVSQFGFFDLPWLDHFMGQIITFRDALIPWIFHEAGGTSGLDNLVRPDDW